MPGIALGLGLGSAGRSLRFSELMEASGLNRNSDTGQFNYHLTELIKRSIVTKMGDEYHLTQFGFRLAKLLVTPRRECSFLRLDLARDQGGAGEGIDDPPYNTRPYSDSDFEGVSRLMMNMHNDAWAEMFGQNVMMSLEEARKAVVTDLLVPDVRVLVLEHGSDKRVVEFVSYAVRHGGVYFIEYEWVEPGYSKQNYDDMLFEQVEDRAKASGETTLYIRVSHREHRFIEFLRGRGYGTLNMLELCKFLGELPKDYLGRTVEVEGHAFRLR